LIEVGGTSATGVIFLSSDIAPGIRCEKTAILAFRLHRRGCNDEEEEEEDDDTEEEGGGKSQDHIKSKSGDTAFSDRQLFSPTRLDRRTLLLSCRPSSSISQPYIGTASILQVHELYLSRTVSANIF